MTTLEKFQWAAAIWRVLTAVVIVTLGVLPTIILGWDTMLPSGKLVAVGGLIAAAWKAADGPISDIFRRVLQGKPPVAIDAPNGNGGHTTHIKKDA